ncbi:hypothetical protein D3C87_1193550 [compost metagenome]
MALKDNRIYVIFSDGETIELNDDPRINQGNLISLREMGMADRPSGKFLITRKTVEPPQVNEPGEIRYFVESV